MQLWLFDCILETTTESVLDDFCDWWSLNLELKDRFIWRRDVMLLMYQNNKNTFTLFLTLKMNNSSLLSEFLEIIPVYANEVILLKYSLLLSVFFFFFLLKLNTKQKNELRTWIDVEDINKQEIGTRRDKWTKKPAELSN